MRSQSAARSVRRSPSGTSCRWPAADSGRVVDERTAGVPLSKERVLVPRDRGRKRAVGAGRGGVAGLVQRDDVVPMSREAIVAADGATEAEDMHRGGLFPERALGSHRGGSRGREHEVRHMRGAIARHRSRL